MCILEATEKYNFIIIACQYVAYKSIKINHDNFKTDQTILMLE